MANALCIGHHADNNDPVYLTEEDLLSHTLIAGPTGCGKTFAQSQILRYRLDNGLGGMCLDFAGQLFDDTIAYAAASGNGNNLILINANDPNYSPGVNALQLRRVDRQTLAAQVVRGMAKSLGDDETESRPRMDRWLRAAVLALTEANMTLADMLEFLSVSDPRLRRAILPLCQDGYVRREWESFDAMAKKSDKENLLEGPLNRASKLLSADAIRRIIGQHQSTIDIGDAIESGKVILVNLAPLTVSRESQLMLAMLLIDQVVNYAPMRTRKQAKRPFTVFVEESAECLASDIPLALQSLRKFGVFFSLCYQTLAQIKRMPGFLENVLSNTRVKLIFGVSRQDSEQLVGELFAGAINGDFVKDEIQRTMFVPHETTRQVISEGRTYSESEGESESDSESESDGFGSGSALGQSLSVSHQVLPDGTIFPRPNLETHGSGSTDSHSSFSSNSRGTSSSRGTSTSRSRSESRIVTTVPFVEAHRERELSSRHYYSVEEIKERYIARIMCQPQRHAHLKVGTSDVIPIVTAFVENIRIRDKDRQRVIAASNAKYALPHPVVDQMIEDRRLQLLNSSSPVRAAIKQDDMDADRWQVIPAEVA